MGPLGWLSVGIWIGAWSQQYDTGVISLWAMFGKALFLLFVAAGVEVWISNRPHKA